MSALTRLRSLVAALVSRRRLERDMELEWRFHLESRVQALMAAGRSRSDAERQALTEFGDPLRWREQAREAWGVRWLQDLAADARYAARQVRRAPAFTALAVVTLALGIGTNTAIFSIVNAVVLRPLPYPDADTLLTLWVENTDGATVGSGWIGSRIGERLGPFGAPYLEDLRARVESLDALEGLSPSWSMVLTRAGEPGPVQTAFVSDGLARLLGIRLVAGRDFTSAEHRPGAAPVAIVSARLWHRLGGHGSPDEERVTLDGSDYTVVGVAEELPLPGMPVDALVPFVQNPFFTRRVVTVMFVIGQLRPGVTIEEARAELGIVSEGLARDYPETSGGRRLVAVPLHERMAGRSRTLLSMLSSAVGLLVLISCANVANLLLGRASARRREIAMRSALGAGPLRIVRQLVTESVLLAGAGAAAGLLLAQWSIGLLTVILAEDLPPGTSAGIDLPVLLFTAAVAVATGVIFGLPPAIQASGATLTDTVRHMGTGPTGERMRRMIVVSEVALAIVLLAGAGLLIRSLWRLTSVDPGFRTDRVLQAALFLPDARYPRPADMRQFFERVIARVEALPGVEAAGLVNRLPLGGAPNNAVSVILDSFTAAPGKEPMVDRRIATPDYFRTMGIPLLAGRPFSPADGADAARVALVNHTMARTFWPEGTALGRRVRIKLLTGDGPWLTIVGVVGNVRHHGLEQEAHPELWVPAAQAPVQGMVLVVRTGGGPALATSQIRAAVSELDPELPVPIASLESVVAASVRAPRSRTLLMAGFAGLALLLAAVGIYAVVSYTVGGLAREIGIRIALGARRSEVIRLVIGQNLVLTAIGIALGLAGAVMVTRYLDRFLFGVTPLDAATYVGASVLLGAVATLASYIPARRATRVDPLVALRAE